MPMKRILWLAACMMMWVTVSAQTDTIPVRDLSPDWRMMSDREGIIPMIDPDGFSGNAIYIRVPLADYGSDLLRIYSGEQVSLFEGERLLAIFSGERWMRMDSLKTLYGDSVILTLYNRPIYPYTIETGIYRVADAATARTIRSEQVIIANRPPPDLRNVIILAIVIIFAFAAVLNFYYPRLTQEFFRFSRAVSFRELDENLMKTRPLSLVNIFYYVFESMLAAWVLFVLSQYSEIHLRYSFFHFTGFWDGMLVWLKLVTVIFILLILKYILVWSFKNLFSIRGFLNNHFYNYIRLGLLFYLVLAIILFIGVFTMNVVNPGFYNGLMITLLIFFGLRALLIFFKLMNESSHTILHLFSYLCATELLPVLLIFSWGINQTT